MTSFEVGRFQFDDGCYGYCTARPAMEQTTSWFCRPIYGAHVLSHCRCPSKWLDAHIMSSITSARTIETLRSVFATHGLLRVIVTDNSSSFTSEEFKTFVCKNGIKHVTSAPYHPSTNGQAERAVQTLIRGLKCTPGNSVQERLTRFLFDYWITPHTITGVPPYEV